jgi:hypothetical protein
MEPLTRAWQLPVPTGDAHPPAQVEELYSLDKGSLEPLR